MTDAAALLPARGKPAAYGHEIVKRRHRRTIERSSFRGKKVLDLGCGNGAQTLEFVADGCSILALDVEEKELRSLALHLRESGLKAILPVLYGGGRLPVADASVDIVVCFEVLEHVPDERQTLGEIRRVVRPGGEVVISVPNKWWLFETHGARLPLLPWNRVPFFSWLPKPIHQRYANARIYRRGEIVELLKEHGFDVKSSEYITAPMDVVTIAWLKHLLRSSLFSGDTTKVPLFSTSILLHCTSPTTPKS